MTASSRYQDMRINLQAVRRWPPPSGRILIETASEQRRPVYEHGEGGARKAFRILGLHEGYRADYQRRVRRFTNLSRRSCASLVWSWRITPS